MRRVRHIVYPLALGFLLTQCGTAFAAWTLIDDFESYVEGSDINGQGGWLTNLDNISNGGDQDETRLVVEDPADSSNQALDAFSGGGTDIWQPMVIGASDTATLFSRFYNPTEAGDGDENNDADFQFGAISIAENVHDEDPPVADGTFTASGVGPMWRVDGGNFEVRNDANSGFINLVTGLERDTWYSVWMVIDNDLDTYGLYIQGGSFASQTQLEGPGSDTTFPFRTSNADPLRNLHIRLNANHENDNLSVDDIYLTSGIDLSNPVPEPTSLLLLLVGAGLLALPRSRNRNITF